MWNKEIENLERLEKMARQMGGPDRVARHHSRGKLTVRERIDLLADPGSFEEIGTLAGSAVYDGDDPVSFTPTNTLIGHLTIEGRPAMVNGGDFTVRGGATEASITTKFDFAEKTALEWRVPYIRLLDATGGSVRSFEKIGYTYCPWGPGATHPVRLMQVVPVVSAVMGSVAGLPAVEACLSHFSVMVKETSQIFVAGPPVVSSALGQEITKEELGSEKIQAVISGVVNNVAANEEEAISLAKGFLSYLPSSVWEMPPHRDCMDDPECRDEDLLSIIPQNPKKPYDPRKILSAVLDRHSIFEISPLYGKSRITALARVKGYPVGVMINNPNYLGGSMDAASGEKVTRFVQMCDMFHLPIVNFSDEPGFMVGLESEKQGMIRIGARVHSAIDQTRIPWISFIIRQAYGVAGACHVRKSGMYKRYAWPSAGWGSMHIEGGAMAAYRREIETSSDPQAKREEIEARLKALASPFKTAHAFDIENIIDPRNTRPLLVRFIESAQKVLKSQLGQTVGPAYRP